ncbi:MAG: hypothetical protein Q8941_00355 [Bacteroidota bacterium]|nr:hypothetical protein [Bacteroidota bacterium]
MQFDFEGEMAKRTDEELIRVLTHDKDNYLPEALAVAENEFRKRNLPAEKISSLAKSLAQKKEIENKKVNEPLNLEIKVLTFIFPVIITFIFSALYKSEG